MSEAEYRQRLARLMQQDTYRQIHVQHFTDAQGRRRYQAVFPKVAGAQR